ncbi:MAG: hypothetical protein KAJ51_17930 [Thermoplasmata archaeon]|nr:hypothetical protein [Thermoplasmata archaeon]
MADSRFQIPDGWGILILAVTCFAKLPRFKNSFGIFKVSGPQSPHPIAYPKAIWNLESGIPNPFINLTLHLTSFLATSMHFYGWNAITA